MERCKAERHVRVEVANRVMLLQAKEPLLASEAGRHKEGFSHKGFGRRVSLLAV